MSKELKSLLVSLGENPEMAMRFRKNPGQVMDACGISIDSRTQLEQCAPADVRNACGANNTGTYMFIW